MTTDIFDGVLFARRKSEHTDWVPHTRNGQAWRKRRVSGPGGKLRWHYEPAPEGEQEQPDSRLSDADRMIADPNFDIRDLAYRGILADALEDEGRSDEAGLLRGVLGDSVVVTAGSVFEPHTMSQQDCLLMLDRELGRLDPSWRSRLTLRPAMVSAGPGVNVPLGAVEAVWPINSSAYQAESLVDTFDAACLLAAVRRNPQCLASPTRLRDEVHNYLADYLAENDDGVHSRLNSMWTWSRLRMSRPVGRTVNTVGPIEIRTMPALRGGLRSVAYYLQYRDSSPYLSKATMLAVAASGYSSQGDSPYSLRVQVVRALGDREIEWFS